MKTSHCCPKCSGRELLHVRQVADHVGESHAHHDRRSPCDAAVDGDTSTTFRVARVRHQGGFGSAGRVESYVCRACGFTEFYTVNVADIPVDGDLVVAVSGARDRPPYR